VVGSKEIDPVKSRSVALWTFAVTSVALVMVMLDNLVVSTALNVIRQELGATIEQLEWTVNAYTLTFAVFLLTGAALGDRFGRRRMFVVGVAIFTAASALAAMSTSVEMLLVGRMAQGIGAAIVTPLTLTLLSAAVPAERRGVALGAWGAVGGLAIAIGPLVGGAIVEGVAWNWIFWINVPIGIALIPLAWFALRESHGPSGRLDLPGVALASVGLFGLVWALVNGNSEGWTSPVIVAAFALGAAFLAAFLLWERRAPAPMLPPRFFASSAFSFASLSAMLMSFGMFGAIFLLAQFLQFVREYSPLEAGAAILPWTLAPMFVAPVAGALSDRIGGGLIMGVGLTLQAIGLAWLGLVSSTSVEYTALVVPFIVSGIGMGLFFAPMANVTLSAVRPEEEGQASGASNAIRELGGVFGVAVLAAVFTRNGSFASPQSFVDGLVPAVLIGSVVVALGALTAFAIPRSRRVTATANEPATVAEAPQRTTVPGEAQPVYVPIEE
jgi:EmrB/QacA subfamily drug resistance transporter